VHEYTYTATGLSKLGGLPVAQKGACLGHKVGCTLFSHTYGKDMNEHQHYAGP